MSFDLLLIFIKKNMELLPKKIILSIILSLIFYSLSAQKEINQYEPESLFEQGLMLFENKHYSSALEHFEKYLSSSNNESNSNIVAAEYYAAVSSLYLGNSKGENKITAFIKKNPTSTMKDHASFLYANSLFNKKKYREALKTYTDIDKNNLNNNDQCECKFKEAYCYYKTNNIDKATPIFKELTETDNIYRDDARYYYAHIMYIDKDTNESSTHFNILKKNDRYSDIAEAYMLQINFDNGNYQEVTENGDQLLSISKKKRKADIALMLAESWHQQGDYAKSLEYYNIAMESSNRRLPREVEFKIGFCKMKENDYEGAIDHFTKVTDKNDKLGQYGSYYMAQCYTNTQQDKFARNTFFKAYKMNFNDTLSENALLNYAALSFIPGIDPFNETIDILDKHIKKHPNSKNISELQDIMIHLLLNIEDYNKALECIEQYPNTSNELKKIHSQLTFNIGIQAYSEKDYEQAIIYLNKTISNEGIDHKTKAEAIYWIADAYYQQKDEANAFKEYQRFVKSPMASNTDVYPIAHYNLGYIFFDKGNFENASVKFKEFLNYDKSSDKLRQSDSWMRIGDCYFIQRQYNNAITSYSNATKTSNRNADYAYYQQAMGYGALGKINEKISCLNIITEKHNKSSFYDKALYEIGVTYLASNDNRSAIAAFEKVVKEKPRSAYARKSLIKIGMTYYNNDENDKALEKLKDVVTKYPNTEESREALNLISNIYRDKNEIQKYFDYIEENNLATISIDKQDSLSFRTIEDFYSKRNYNETLKGAKQYLEIFPNGAYLLKVHYYAMKSMENTGNIAEIRPHIEYIINQHDNDYTDNALLLIARMDYDASDYSSSAKHYDRLISITENQSIMIEAIEGCMKSYYFNKEYDKAIEKANQLTTISEITTNQTSQANYILGKSYYDKNDYEEALKYLNLCMNANDTELGAECGYYSVDCLYKLKRYEEAEEKVFYVSDNYNSYIYWTARSFIILSDVYVAKNNTFQAKETLKSVIDNYPEDERYYTEILQEAQDKLSIINNDFNK